MLPKWWVLCVVPALVGCAEMRQPDATAGLRVVATTNIVGDIVENIGGERVDVQALMGPGVDPHLFKASARDVTRMASANVIVYNGLHLEGKMTDVFEEMRQRGVAAIALADVAVPPSLRRGSELFQGNYDPHIWFDVALWRRAALQLAEELGRLLPEHAEYFDARARTYAAELDSLEAHIRRQVARVPAQRRVIVTSHDAFGYFGRAYGFEVRGLQGISTATEAGTADVQDLASLVAGRRIPAMFVESSVSPRGIEAVREAVRARGFDVAIGGTLYGDALGAPGQEAGSYVDMVRHNVATIVDALSHDAGH